MKTQESIRCPSNRCKPGSELLGIRQDDGSVAILPQPLYIDEHFIEQVSKDEMPPEQRFRFTNKCVESGCNQWNGKGCGVIDRVVQHLQDVPALAQLPVCGIRQQCRWFRQHQFNACKVCRFIITEISEEQILEAQTQDLSLEDIRNMVI